MARSSADTPQAYLDELEPERSAVVAAVRDLVNASIRPGFDERMAWGMISWDVPLEISGPTYNGQPLQYVGLAAQKRHFALYLMCAYASAEQQGLLAEGFAAAGKKLDMGKSCLRFRSIDDLDVATLARVIGAMTPEDYSERVSRG